MRASAALLLAASLALAACNRAKQEEPAPPKTPAEASAPQAELAKKGTARPSTGSLPEPTGPVDPKSLEAAGQVVQHYGALIERDRFLQAERLWNDPKAARGFATVLDARFKDVHLEIGELGASEGAAGSIYADIPVAFYGTSGQGRRLRVPASVTLRRVNDVPGSTERQRRWHIERIDWKGQPKAG